MTLSDTLISFETARLAKKKGFDIIVKNYYDHNGDLKTNKYESNVTILECHAPNQSFLQQWIREEYNTNIWISCTPYLNSYTFNYNLNQKIITSSIKYTKYEDALEKGLQEVLKLI